MVTFPLKTLNLQTDILFKKLLLKFFIPSILGIQPGATDNWDNISWNQKCTLPNIFAKMKIINVKKKIILEVGLTDRLIHQTQALHMTWFWAGIVMETINQFQKKQITRYHPTWEGYKNRKTWLTGVTIETQPTKTAVIKRMQRWNFDDRS